MNESHTFTRRTLIQAAGSAVGGFVATRGLCDDRDERSMLIIDCHAHIYGEDEKKYPTIEEPYRPPRRTGTISHLRREMQAAGVRYVTAIQTSTFYRWDNRFTADSARDNKDFMVGVVTLDPDDERSPKMLETYVKEYNVRGMRSIPARSGRLDDPGVIKLWATAERLGIVINALVNRDKRKELETLVRRHPKLAVVIDHCLNLKAGPTLKATLQDMIALSKLPTVHAKLTFIPTGSASRILAETCTLHVVRSSALSAQNDAFGGAISPANCGAPRSLTPSICGSSPTNSDSTKRPRGT